MSDEGAPFALVALGGGRHELRAFSDIIRLELDAEDGRTLGLAVAEVLTSLDTPGMDPRTMRLTLAGRDVLIEGTSERGLRVTVGR